MRQRPTYYRTILCYYPYPMTDRALPSLRAEDKIKVIIADDHHAVRAGIREILTESDAIAVIGEASSGKELLKIVQITEADVILLDLSMPDGGIGIIASVRETAPSANFLVLSSCPDAMYGRKALQAGASGYLVKSSASEHLIETIFNISK